MQYRIVFEIAAAILWVVILLRFYQMQQFPTRKARVFLAFIWVSIIECFFNMVSVIGLANAQFVPQLVNELFAFAFFVVKGALLLYLFMQKPNQLMSDITGIGNRNALKLILTQKIEKKKPFGICSVELKDFHQMQIMFGKENCEVLLREIGQYLLKLNKGCRVFRRRDESFDIVLEQETDRGKLLETLRERFTEEWHICGNDILADAIIIQQQYPNDFKDLPEFLEMQEYLLEQAYEQGQQVIESNRTFREQYGRRKKVEHILQKAVKERSFEVYFQPIYSLREKQIVSLEALTRLKDEQLGVISPNEFIPLAEKNGSILALSEIVLENCCRFLAKHILSNDSLGIRRIQINISRVQCMQQNLKGMMLPILEKYHIPPSLITLEVTESIAALMPELMLRQMKECGEIGIEFAVDNYGTGNSKLSSLVKFPFREIKIDKDRTWSYFENETARIILENEIQTMKGLGIPVVVEGIETKEQSDAMEALGVNDIQGYYYGKPMPEKECLVYIRKFYDER